MTHWQKADQKIKIYRVYLSVLNMCLRVEASQGRSPKSQQKKTFQKLSEISEINVLFKLFYEESTGKQGKMGVKRKMECICSTLFLIFLVLNTTGKGADLKPK